MSDKFSEIYSKVTDNEAEFLVEFMFQLTILGRVIFMDFDGEKRTEASKQLNEMNHRILNRLRDLGNVDPWCTKEYLNEMTSHHIELAPHIGSGVEYAADRAYTKVNA